MKDPSLLVRTEAAICLSYRDLEGVVTLEDLAEARMQLEDGLKHYCDKSFQEDIQWALKQFQSFGATPTPILDGLRSPDREARSRAAQALWMGADGKVGKEAVPLLLEMITESEHSTQDALLALIKVGEGDPSVVPVVRNVLEGKVVRFHTEGLEALGTSMIMSAAWQVLARNQTPEAGRALCEMLQDTSMKWNPSLFRAIAGLGDNASCALPELKRLFEDSQPPPTPARGGNYDPEGQRRYRLLYLAGCLGVFGVYEEKAIPVLLEGLRDSKPWMRFAAAENIAHWGAKTSEAISSLIEMLGADQSSWAGATWMFPPRNPALSALASMGRAAVPQLVEALRNGKREERLRVAEVLGMIGPDAADAVPELIKALEAEKHFPRNHIVALGEIGPGSAEAIPYLLRVLRGSNLLDRTAAIDAIKKMGAAAIQAVPDLESISADEDQDNAIRKSARLAALDIRKASGQDDKK